MKSYKLYLVIFFVFTCLGSSFAQESIWQTRLDSANCFSSPRFTDLNEDGVLDVVIGAGIESVISGNGVVALDGKTGSMLWHVKTKTQIYTSALFQDLNKDKVNDVIIGGRAGSLLAINGKTGDVLWEFYPESKGDPRRAGILNFFATQWIEDQNKDGFLDLLAMNGGDYLAMPNVKTRPTAKLMIISGLTGELISSASIPEKRESYYAPHTYDKDGKIMVVFGTGGETVGGSLWEVPLSSVLKGNISKSTLIVQDSIKGFILNSILTDLNGDQKPEIIHARMNSTVCAIDGNTHKILWEKSFEGYECYVTPSLGHFNADKIPDVFTIMAFGSFPMYSSFKLVVFDGKTGELILEEDSGFNQFSPAISADLDQDHIDEIIFIENKLLDPEQFKVVNQVRVINISKKETHYLGEERQGVSMASSPALIDLDMDGLMELVVASSSFAENAKDQFSILERIDLQVVLQQITWPGYLGPKENGFFSGN